MTPEMIHYKRSAAIIEARQTVLTRAYSIHPERFVRRPPTPPAAPTAVWINPPKPARVMANDEHGSPLQDVTVQECDSIGRRAPPVLARAGAFCDARAIATTSVAGASRSGPASIGRESSAPTTLSEPPDSTADAGDHDHRARIRRRLSCDPRDASVRGSLCRRL